MKLSQRLQCVADFIEDGSSVFDVGADHGGLEIFLSKERNIRKIIAVDNKIGPFSILQKNTSGLENVQTILSSGLDDYDSICDTVVMAGMGGLLINSLINEHLEYLPYINNFVIDAHRNIPEVRQLLSSFGYKIAKEKIVKENKHYYIVILFKKGEHESYTDEQILHGVCLKDDPLYSELQECEFKRLQTIENKRNEQK